MAAILISIRPSHVDKIVAGDKTVELRRGNASVSTGDWLVVYSTSPEKRIRAVSRVGTVLRSAPDRLCRKVLRRTGLTRDEFRSYFNGASAGTAMELTKVTKLQRPVELDDARANAKPFVVPRSYRCLTREEARSLGLPKAVIASAK